MSETTTNDEFSLSILKEELKAALHSTKQSRIPLFIAAMAALLSVASLADDETDKVAMSAHIEAANKFSYFQGKNIRKTESEIAAQLFAKLNAPDLAERWQKKADRYDREKADILKDAREQQKIRDQALRQGDYYKVGVTLLQIAIVMASASLVFGGGLLFGISLFLTIISVVYTVNGYGLFYDIPTSPGTMVDAARVLYHQMMKAAAP